MGLPLGIKSFRQARRGSMRESRTTRCPSLGAVPGVRGALYWGS